MAISSYIQTHDTTSFADIAAFWLAYMLFAKPLVNCPLFWGPNRERALTMIQTLITASTDADHVFLGVTPTMRPELLTAMKQLV